MAENKYLMRQYLHWLTIIIGLMILPITAAAEDDSISAEIAEAYVEMHTGAGRGYPVFYIAERGEKITLLKQRTGWIKVRTTNGKEGWVKMNSIAKTLDANGEQMAISHPQLDQFSNRKWELGFMLGDFGGTDVITAYTGYHLTKNISAEVALSENFGNFSSGQSASISILHQPFPEWRYSPFIKLGGGVRKTDPRSSLVATEDRTDDFLVAGAGLRIYLSQRFILRIQYQQHTVLTSRDDDIDIEEWKIGLSAFF
jgi:uncharacterized protein YgiM (DUF1202 family)